MDLDKLYNRDCIKGMAGIPPESIDLAFADPPFNIGYDYDVYKDRLKADKYLAWTQTWGQALVRTLKPTGTFWLAIGDDFAAELKLLFQRDLDLVCRSWVIWYYTFGVNCKQKFSRSHTHLFHFVKDPKNFTFNADTIRVPSARQLVYADKRAHSKGRLPDDTWILRPQDAPDSFTSQEDVWHFPRVCGSFTERAGWHGCQMPEQLLGRIIKACSNPGDTVLDPFGGSGTTLAVAKKLARRFIGFELSKNYALQIDRRLEATRSGDSLSGPDNPATVAPPTAAGRALAALTPPASKTAAHRPPRAEPPPSPPRAPGLNRPILEAFLEIRSGFPVDRIIADPDLNQKFIDRCTHLAVPGQPVDWNWRLMNLRKAGYFRGLTAPSPIKPTWERKEFYRYKFACEIAIQRFEHDNHVTLDHVLCDPALANEFDQYVLSMLPDDARPTSFKIRWFALRIRKDADRISHAAASLTKLIHIPKDFTSPFALDYAKVSPSPGLYWLRDHNRRLYVGETNNLRERLETQFGHRKFDFWGAPHDELLLTFKPVDVPVPTLPRHQSRWISKWQPIGNFGKLAASLQAA